MKLYWENGRMEIVKVAKHLRKDMYLDAVLVDGRRVQSDPEIIRIKQHDGWERLDWIDY